MQKLFNTEKAINGAVRYIVSYVHDAGCSKVVLGVSGGKDSTVVAMLAVRALGKSNVYGVIMPNGKQKDIDDAIEVCETLGINYTIRDISSAYASFIESDRAVVKSFNLETINAEAMLNVAPRLRMATLYMAAAELGDALVIGTGNLCERIVGYFTKYGDGGCDFNPIGLLTVNEVVAMGIILSDEFGLDTRLVTKTPEDGLSGVSDEEKLGVSYSDISKYVRGNEELIDANTVIKIKQMCDKAEHKLKMPDMYNYYS